MIPSGFEPIEVAAALIFRTGRLLITQRPAKVHLGGLWEFPGGKREPGEKWEDCVIREIREELGVDMIVGELYSSVTHSYRNKTVHIKFFTGTVPHGEPGPIGCAACRWITHSELDQFRFPDADAQLLVKLKNARHLWNGAS